MKNITYPERIEFIDFAKGFAMLFIVLYHLLNRYATGMMASIIMLGGSGIHLFLILSGFGLSLSAHSMSPMQFYKRRFVRILVPYYLFITFLFVINQFIVFFPEGNFYAYMGHILWYKMFDESIFGSFGVPMWFLSVIIQFYLAFPLLLFIRKRLGNRLFLIITSLVSIFYWIVIGALGLSDRPIFTNFFLQYLWEFCIGMVLAENYKERGIEFWKQKRWILILTAGIGIGLLGLMATRGGWLGREFNDIPAALGYTALAAWSYSLAQHDRGMVKSLVFIGQISYELYLVHEFVAMVLIKFIFSRMEYNLSYATSLIILPAAILASFLFRKMTQPLIRNISTVLHAEA